MFHHLLNGSLAIVLVLCVTDAKSEPPQQSKRIGEIGHLEPIMPYPDRISDNYWKAYYKLFKIREYTKKELFEPWKYGAVVMVRKPSFHPEECLILKEKYDEVWKYELIHVKASRNIWYAMDNGGKGRKKPRKVSVKTTHKSIDPDRAARVCLLWARMLRGVRYRGEGIEAGGVDDGESYEFQNLTMHGESRNPMSGSPLLLAELGNALVSYCTAMDDQSGAALELVDEKCKELERFLDAEDAVKKS